MKRNFIIWLIVLGFLRTYLLAAPKDENFVPEADIQSVVAGNNQFAFELYAKLKDDASAVQPDGNLFFSPYSISTALALTYAGARGETEKQMAETLHFALEQDKLHHALGSLEKQLAKGSKKKSYELNIANALWGQKDYSFLAEFLQLNKKYYGAGFNEVDFVHQSEKARKTINTWVEKKTKDKIKELIGEGILGRDTVLVLTNAIYFKGTWLIQFDKKDTRQAPFKVSANKKVNVPMMYLKDKFDYRANEELQILELPYKGKDLSMIILLPKEVDGLEQLESKLTSENLNIWLKELHKQEVMVYLPKFEMTWGSFDIVDILRSMGMADTFSLPPADFSGMDGTRSLVISNILHKAFVKVNEEGTEAAAATAVVIAKTSMGPVFRADHPFVFMIKDNRSGSILFMGRISNPASQDK